MKGAWCLCHDVEQKDMQLKAHPKVAAAQAATAAVKWSRHAQLLRHSTVSPGLGAHITPLVMQDQTLHNRRPRRPRTVWR